MDVGGVFQSQRLNAKKNLKSNGEKLKFLVIGKNIDYGGPINPADFVMALENLVLPSFEILKDWETKGKVVGGFFAAQRAGAIIIDAPTAEDLSMWLQGLPFWSQNNWEIIPLQTIQSGIEDVKRQIANVKKMADMAAKQPKYESAPI